MPEHTHQWVAHYDQVVYGESFQCECGDLMATDEIERRLNATEMLSASEAVRAASSLYFPKTPGYERLMAYAAALEGKNGTE